MLLILGLLSFNSYANELCSLSNQFKDFEDIKAKLEAQTFENPMDRRCTLVKGGWTFTMDIISREKPHVFVKIETPDKKVYLNEYVWDRIETIEHVKLDEKAILKQWDDKVYQLIFYRPDHTEWDRIEFDQKKDCQRMQIFAYTTETWEEHLAGIKRTFKDAMELWDIIYNDGEEKEEKEESKLECWSEWLKRSFSICQGEDSICIKGENGATWARRDSDVVRKQCPNIKPKK